jgi:hypothetical protein
LVVPPLIPFPQLSSCQVSSSHYLSNLSQQLTRSLSLLDHTHGHTMIFPPAFLDSSSCWNTNHNQLQVCILICSSSQFVVLFSQGLVHTQEKKRSDIRMLARVCCLEISIQLMEYTPYKSC